VPREIATKAGPTNKHVQIRKDYGGRFPANLEGIHHFQCLNMLRLSSYYNYEFHKAMRKGVFTNNEPILESHIRMDPLFTLNTNC
jgi:hypothetical protein